MATLGEIKAEVKRIVEEDLTELTSEITTHVNRAQRAIEDMCSFRVQHAASVMQVTRSELVYELPTDFVSIRNKPFYNTSVSRASETSGTNLSDIDRTFLEELPSFNGLGNSRASGKPTYWGIDSSTADLGERIAFWPIGDGLGPSASTTGAYEIVLNYYKRLSTLTADSDTNWWSINMDDVLSFRAAALLFAEMRDPQTNYWDARATTRLKEIRSQTKRNLMRERGTSITPTQPLSSRSNRRFRREIIARIPTA